MDFETPVTQLNNIGEKRGAVLKKLGIETVRDVVEHYPRDYDDRSRLVKIADIEMDARETFVAAVRKSPENLRLGGKIFTRVRIGDATGELDACWFNQGYMSSAFHVGDEFAFTGTVRKKYGKKQIMSPDFEKIKDEGLLWSGSIVPVYSITAGLSQKVLRKIIKDTLDLVPNAIYEFMPMSIRKTYKLCERSFAVKNIHFPSDDESFFVARYRLVFEELFLMQTALFRMKAFTYNSNCGELFEEYNMDEFLSALPFKFTAAQSRVYNELKADMHSGKAMNRLIQGDVGSGKTAVAMAACFQAVKNGFQAVLMAPTEVLAAQHLASFREVFDCLGIRVDILTGTLKAKEKRDVLNRLAKGDIDIIIGTHAVIQKDVVFYKLGMVVTDEQHRFGVNQRLMLSDKGRKPHAIVMTATPIPRTLALILYGDLDISIIDELPPGRQKIDTRGVTSAYHERIYTFIKKEIKKGRQAYIICPMIDESEKMDLKSVMEYTAELSETVFKGYNVACVHGKLKSGEKETVMHGFAAGKINILVATTVIEVGINVPNATVMLIENAERFGLAQLHQLRGRVGRGGEQSYCILVSDSKTPVTKERLSAMTKTADGFEISELDLKLRGPGEFFGTRQHGLPELKIANLYTDMAVLKEAQKAAKEIIESDPQLVGSENLRLSRELNRFYSRVKIII